MASQLDQLRAFLEDDPQGQRQALVIGLIVFLGFWVYRLLLTGGGRSFLDAVIAGVIAFVAAYLVHQWRPGTTLPAEPTEP